MMSDVGSAIYHTAVAMGVAGSVFTSVAGMVPGPKLGDFFEVQSVQVERVGDTALFTVDRVIHAPIVMGFVVRVMEKTDHGPVQNCKASSAPFKYTPKAAPIVGKDLSWWTDGQCVTLPPGPVEIITTWTPVNTALGALTNVVEVDG